ncbi:unnamed protein product [Owenia fusiformis]|uniref:RING-type domain-containing protein n=1 Tax=Owenia fusiformis TaxID=6347 RepID=A0A8S4PY24_OWEFU|nr:unnamed protein product [Owenia fusiformis]
MGNIFAEPVRGGSESDHQRPGQTGLESLYDQLQCSICFEDYSTVPPNPPKILHCGHSFCGSCIDRCKTYDSIQCPTCREKTSHEPRMNLPDNYLAKAFLEYKDEMSKMNYTSNSCTTCSKKRGVSRDQGTMTMRKSASENKSTMTLQNFVLLFLATLFLIIGVSVSLITIESLMMQLSSYIRQISTWLFDMLIFGLVLIHQFAIFFGGLLRDLFILLHYVLFYSYILFVRCIFLINFLQCLARYVQSHTHNA